MEEPEYAYIPASIFKQEYRLTYFQEYMEMAIYAVAAFSIPFIFGSQQLLVGSVVNCALVLAALNIRGRKLLPVLLLPSVGAYAAGMIFGSASMALLTMIPFIWLGNALLVLAIKQLTLSMKRNRVLALVAGSGFKAGFLFVIAFSLFGLGLVPAAFLTAMGVIQLATALMGGAAALLLQEAKKRV